MILELIMERFGKFKKKSFLFSGVTIFYGENESGKTTIFDALIVSLCKISKTNKLIKQIYDRYGDDFKVMVKTEENGLKKYDINEFMNLNAIRSGEMSFRMSDGNFLEHVKSNFFSGGVDPKQIAGIFEKLSSDDGKLGFNKDIKYIEETISALEDRLGSLNERKVKLTDSETGGAILKNEIVGLRMKISSLSVSKDRIENELATQEKIIKKNKFKSILSDISRKNDLELALNPVGNLKNDDLKILKEWENELNVLKGKMGYIDEEIKNLKYELDTQSGCRIELKNGMPDNIIILLDQLNSYKTIPFYKNNHFIKMPFFITGLLLSLASLIPVFLIDQKWILAVTFSLFALTVFLSVGKEKIQDVKKENTFIKKIRDDAENRAFVKLHSNTISGIYEELLNKKIEIENAMKNAGEAETKIEEQKKRIYRSEMQKRQYESRHTELKNKIDRWYSSRGVKNTEEYLDNKNKFSLQQSELEKLTERIDGYKTEMNVLDTHGLKTECERKLKILDEEFIPDTGMTDVVVNQKKIELKKLYSDLGLLNLRREDLEKKFEGSKGFIQANFSDLPGDIAESEKQLLLLNDKLDDMRLTKKSAAELKYIFDEISENSDTMFVELGDEMKKHFSMIVPEIREVSMERLDENSIYVQDSHLIPRKIDHLSRGTRDSFLFASRLMFSLKSISGFNDIKGGNKKINTENTMKDRDRNIVLLDEPFSSFDEFRERKAIEMLKYFSENFNYQIVILTKEKRIVDISKDIFKDQLTVHFL